MSLHHEIAFEREICEHLGANGWLHEEGSAAAYSRELALYAPDLIGWVQEAQPEAWEVLQKNHGTKAEATLLQRVRQQLDQVGTLDLLRHGVEVLGLPKALKLAEFKPAFGLNPQVLARQVVLTHHHLRDLGTKKLDLKQGDSPAIPGMDPGGGGVQDKNKVELAEIIAKLNELFSGDLGDNDKLPYVCSVIRGKLLESSTLCQQAAANSKEQFSNSPDLNKALLDAIIGALDAHQLMSTQALNSEDVREGMIDILLNHTNLYEDLRDQGLKE